MANSHPRRSGPVLVSRSIPSGPAGRGGKGRLGLMVIACLAGGGVLLGASPALAVWPPPPTLPDPPAGSTCVFIQRGTLGQVWDADVGLGNGTWAAGAYP